MKTAFYWDEKCLWHSGGNYAFTLPVGGLVQPMVGGLPESPETKRRLKNLLEVTGLIHDLHSKQAEPAHWDDLTRVHPASFLRRFKELSDGPGGELGPRAPFANGGFEIATLSAGLAQSALCDVLSGLAPNSYALSRPPGHHCLPELPNGFCLLNNIAIAIETAMSKGLTQRIAVVDWDVHHGNGTEAIFYDRDDVFTISLHQERNYPMDTGDCEDRGAGAGFGANMNIPLPPGSGHNSYIEAFERLVIPALQAYGPDAIVVACGYDASAVDPLSRTLATAETFRLMTQLIMETAHDLCDGRLTFVHEGGYSEVYVPFCGHGVLQELSQSAICAPDPIAQTLTLRQPSPRFDNFVSSLIGEMEDLFF